MKFFLITITIIIFLYPISLIAQDGKIAGRITNSETGEPIAGVSVFLEESEKGVYSSTDGTYLISDVPIGNYTIHARLMGFEQQNLQVVVETDITTIMNFKLEIKAIQIEGVKISANRAVKRETPIAFTDIDQEAISDKYTTQDMPQLLEDVPGLFANTTGIGDAEITMRGFEADKIQVLINGIPVNDPESQKVYWSNWTGLASNVKSVQVQKGAGSSLYGSGAFGGSLNIETMGSTPNSEITVRSSYGRYFTDGNTANGEGEIIDYKPFNYNLLTRYNSGNLYGGKFNYNIMLEKKRGDYYLNGTNYDGYSFGIEAQNIISDHTINTSFLGAPQEHNQVYFKSDPDLFETLGRSYNRNNHSYQENYYFKPQFSIRDKWNISESQIMMTNIFVTKGDGGGKYLSQDKFDINTGKIHFRDGFLDEEDPMQWEDNVFGKHALYLYETYGIEVEEFVGQDTVWFGSIPVVGSSYKGNLISGNGVDFFSDPARFQYSWRNNRISDHFQAGLNTYYQQDFNPQLQMVLGGELRSWHANHIGKRENFRHYDDEVEVETFDTMQKTYDYITNVINMSAFTRFQYKPISNLNIMADGQYAIYTSNIEENPIEIYDLGTGQPTGYFFYSTKETVNPDSTLKFENDDYSKVYSFFSPKFGINYNISKYFNVMANYSLAYKEPRTTEWYSGYDGPDGNQLFMKNIVLTDSLGNYYNQDEEHFYGELKPEKINTIEFGLGYDGVVFDINANYYISDYTNKIEHVTIPISEEYAETDTTIVINEYDASLTLNAGEARHQGLELSSTVNWMNFDVAGSLTLSSNRWVKMNVEEIFDMASDEMIDKVVPFSPETMANTAIGYTINNLPLNGKMRVGVNAKYWDGYYANYENEYYSNYIYDGSDFVADTTSIVSSKLPEFLEFGAKIKYSFKIQGMDASLKLDFNNILNEKDNYLSARVASDYNRGYFDVNGDFQDDYLTGNRYMYLTPSPLFSMFVTMEIKF